ncbi:MAG: hypothetical protein ACOX88_03620 [Christensenellales bacterium]
MLLGFINLYSLRKSEQSARQYSLNTVDYEKRRDFILEHLSEYIHLLDVHELSFMALTDEEYEGKDLDIHKKLYSLETLYYKIKLMINPENLCYEEFSIALDKSISLAREIRAENSFAELFTNGLRTPERALEISRRALELMKKEAENNSEASISIDIESEKKEKLDFISEAIETRDKHLKNYLSAAEALVAQKEHLVIIAQKYLMEEKMQLLDSKRKGG